jgi:hypothetical protein
MREVECEAESGAVREMEAGAVRGVESDADREPGLDTEPQPGLDVERDPGPDRRWDLLSSLRRLTDAELVARVEALATRERGATALLVAHLAELDTRDIYLRAGYSSLFAYCREALSLSEHEAFNRIEVARAARRFPVILELLAAGTVNLTTVRLLSPHLTPENHRGVLESARGKKRAEVEEIVARLAPFPEAPSFVRKLPAPRPAYPPPLPRGPEGPFVTFAPAPAASPAAGSPPAAGIPVDSVAGSVAALPSGIPTDPSAGLPPGGSPPVVSPPADSSLMGCPPAGASSSGLAGPGLSAPARPATYPCRQTSGEVTPLAPDRYKLQCTIDGTTLEKLRLAKDMLRHAIPSGDDAAILDRAFTALLADLLRSKFAAVGNPQPCRGATPGSRHIPAEVKRAVWLRDLGRCAFVGTDGRRCNERAFVEFHHLRPYAVGGDATVQNIQLRCRRHNGYEARVFFDRGQADDGEGVVREAGARYGHERALQSAGGQIPNARGQILTSPGRPAVERGGRKVVPERVRMTASAGSSYRVPREPGPDQLKSTSRHPAAGAASATAADAAATHLAAATQLRTSGPTEADGGSTSAASGRAARGSRASAG